MEKTKPTVFSIQTFQQYELYEYMKTNSKY